LRPEIIKINAEHPEASLVSYVAEKIRAGNRKAIGAIIGQVMRETKGRAEWIRRELERRLPGFDTPVTINVNGCPNSCARIQTADIGLKGSLVIGPDGRQTEGFQIHLGGSLGGGDGENSGFGRKIRGLKTTAEDLPDYLERVLRRFQEGRSTDETFAAWAGRASEEDFA